MAGLMGLITTLEDDIDLACLLEDDEIDLLRLLRTTSSDSSSGDDGREGIWNIGSTGRDDG